MKLLLQTIGFLVKILVSRALRPRTVFAPLATTSLLLCGSALVTSWWEPVAEHLTGKALSMGSDQVPRWSIALFFLALTSIFAAINYFLTRGSVTEPVVHTPIRSTLVRIGASRVRCFCGSIELLTDVDVIVTSENQHLTLGSVAGPSVSGRVRRAVAEFDEQGNLTRDRLREEVDQWKSTQPHLGPYPLGTVIEAPAFAAERQGVCGILLAIALHKNSSGVNSIDAQAIHRIISYVLHYCEQHSLTSVFLPIFGLGSGAIDPDEAICKTLEALAFHLRSYDKPLVVDVGTYRTSHTVKALTCLAELRDR